jgi:pimeloyl-ACP methyl ester carboxylesterase
MRDYQVEVNKIKLQVREYERQGEAIIFLHYGGSNLAMWQGVAPYFQDDYRLLMIDLRGHGKSDCPQQGYHIDQMAADVAGVMEYLQIERIHVVGSSLGAEVGLSLAANYPDQVLSLVCEGALHSEYGPFGVHDMSEQEFRAMVTRMLAEIRERQADVYASVQELLAASQQEWEKYGWWNELIEAAESYGIRETAEGLYTKSWRAWARDEYMSHYFDYRFEDYYRRVQCPVLMLPDESAVEDESQWKAMQGLSQLARSCKIVQVPGAVHPFGWMLFPQRMSQAVLEFLAEI